MCVCYKARRIIRKAVANLAWRRGWGHQSQRRGGPLLRRRPVAPSNTDYWAIAKWRPQRFSNSQAANHFVMTGVSITKWPPQTFPNLQILAMLSTSGGSKLFACTDAAWAGWPSKQRKQRKQSKAKQSKVSKQAKHAEPRKRRKYTKTK